MILQCVLLHQMKKSIQINELKKIKILLVKVFFEKTPKIALETVLPLGNSI